MDEACCPRMQNIFIYRQSICLSKLATFGQSILTEVCPLREQQKL